MFAPRNTNSQPYRSFSQEIMLFILSEEYSRLAFSSPSVMMTNITFSARYSSSVFFCTLMSL